MDNYNSNCSIRGRESEGLTYFGGSISGNTKFRMHQFLGSQYNLRKYDLWDMRNEQWIDMTTVWDEKKLCEAEINKKLMKMIS